MREAGGINYRVGTDTRWDRQSSPRRVAERLARKLCPWLCNEQIGRPTVSRPSDRGSPPNRNWGVAPSGCTTCISLAIPLVCTEALGRERVRRGAACMGRMESTKHGVGSPSHGCQLAMTPPRKQPDGYACRRPIANFAPAMPACQNGFGDRIERRPSKDREAHNQAQPGKEADSLGQRANHPRVDRRRRQDLPDHVRIGRHRGGRLAAL